MSLRIVAPPAGQIGNAKNARKSVDFTPEGFEAAREAFERLFMVEE